MSAGGKVRPGKAAPVLADVRAPSFQRRTGPRSSGRSPAKGITPTSGEPCEGTAPSRERPGLEGILCAVLMLFLVLPAGSAAAAESRQLTILTEDFPPFNFTRDNRLQGFATDILEMVLKEAGLSIPARDFQVLPWARAYNVVLTRPNTLLYSVTRTADRETLFKWVGPIAPNRNVLLARKDRKISIRAFTDVLRYKAGAIRDDAGEQLLLAWGYPGEQLDRTVDAKSNMLKLDSGRIDLFAYPETVFRWVARQAGKRFDDYETVFVLHDGYVYFALNKDTPDEVVDRLQRALDSLLASGRAQDAIDRYLQ